jgi:hypothetical protein
MRVVRLQLVHPPSRGRGHSVGFAFVGSKTAVRVILVLNHTVLLLYLDGGSTCSDTLPTSSSLSL